MGSLGKHPEHQRADDEAYRYALDRVVNGGANLAEVVPELRRSYAENVRSWAPAEWRGIMKVKAKGA